MTAADPLGALRAYLLADAALADLVDGRVRALALHAGEESAMPFAAVVLKPAGGPGARGYQEFSRRRIDVICYGATLDESWDVYLAVQPLMQQLNRAVVQNVLLHSATEESSGSAGIRPDTEWPTTYSSWRLLASDIAA